MPPWSENPAQRRYNARIGWAMGLYVLVLVVEHRLIGAVSNPPLRYLLAVLPALPVMACFLIMSRYLVEERDEYLRSRTVTQILGATGLTLSAATLWGFLEDAGAPHLPMFFVTIGWFLALGLIACFRKVTGR